MQSSQFVLPAQETRVAGEIDQKPLQESQMLLKLVSRNRLCQPKSLLAFGGDVGAEPISQASSLDEPLTFESLQPVPHVLNAHLGCDSEAGVVHVVG